MTRWKKDETEFTVRVSYDTSRGSLIYMPKPLLERIGLPESVRFVVRGSRIEVGPA